MERLITVKDVSERYGCSLPTARKYIRQCNPHMENPLATYEWAFREWEEGRLVVRPYYTPRQKRELMEAIKKGPVFVPRRRE